jgi:hypothetical protein
MTMLLFRLIPAPDREAITGDLLEEAAFRDLRGAARASWLAHQCAAIALGLSIQRVRAWFVVAPIREIASGIAMRTWWTVRGDRSGVVVRGLAFCGWIATLTLGVELLVRTLLRASGF